MTAQPFDPTGPIPLGITVLEASAGTGKTHSLASLAVRFVAEGTSLDKLLLVTFTRLATSEMRDRIWQRLVEAERDLEQFLIDGTKPTDEVHAFLTEGEVGRVRVRRGMLSRAVAEFDRATICTIHQFCHLVLSGLGFAGDVERDATFIEDDRSLIREVIDDLYVRKWSRPTDDKDLPHAVATAVAEAAVRNPSAPLLPEGASLEITKRWSLRRRFAGAVRNEVEQRKRQRQLLSYDDLLVRLQRDLADPHRGSEVAQRLRERFDVVIVDEFQDTDAVQWQILRDGFGTGRDDGRLVLIGDPKQAIYSFRGADVHAYLDAATEAAHVRTLATNWRSDAPLLDALETVFGGVRLGNERIEYQSTAACPGHEESAIVGAGAPLQFRVLPHEVERSDKDNIRNAVALDYVSRDVASDIAAKLSSDAEIDGKKIMPGDIAVLVRTNKQASHVHQALRTAGVPAVQHGGRSVFRTDAARDWLRLLAALERPAAPRTAHRAVLTSFFGWSAARVTTATDEEWNEVHTTLHRWARRYREAGLAALFEATDRSQGVSARVLGVEGGERLITDLRHVAELLHEHAAEDDLSVPSLAAWLTTAIAEAERAQDADEQVRRLDVDHAAVEIITLHKSKGLEWPIVYTPFLWSVFPSDKPDLAIPVFHDDLRGRCVDVGGPAHPEYAANEAQWKRELSGEELRLTYVGLTRARHQVVAWLADTWDSRLAPLPRVVASLDDGSTDERVVLDQLEGPLRSDEALRILQRVADASGGRISVEAAVCADARWTPPADAAVDLAASPFERPIDTTWVRTSYSSLTAAAYEQGHADVEHLDSGDTDEPDVALPSTDDEIVAGAIESPMASLPGGAQFGTFVHDVMEHVDYAAPDLVAEVTKIVDEAHVRHRVEGDLDVLVGALTGVIRTPLGPTFGDLPLEGVERGDRLDELSFELPLAGGDTTSAVVTMHDLSALWQRTVPDTDSLAAYGARLDDPILATQFRGYLTGSIDLVLRRNGRYVVIDHKSNWLGPPGETLAAWHYRPTAMADAMMEANYPLQALLYSVALYRYLRWRLPSGDAGASLGGVAYLFLRGMTGPDVPFIDGQPCGVFTWTPPLELVVGTSDLLAGKLS